MSIFKLELKRSIFNKWTLFSFLVALVICFIPVVEKYEYVENLYADKWAAGYEQVVSITTAYHHWFLYDRMNGWLYIFLFIMPLLAAFPYGASYYSDVKTGYIKQIVSRCNKKTYTLAKYTATFISGGTVIAAPLIIQFMILTLIFPIYKPMPFTTVLGGEESFTIDLFFEHPLIHTLFWCMIAFIVSGLMATLSLCISRFIYNYFGIILTPFVFAFVLIFLTYVTGKIEISFIYTISTQVFDYDYWIMFAEMAGMFIISFFTFVFQKKEVL